MDSRKIPLTKNFVPQLNELIISYLPPGNIKKLLETETTDINDQIYILGAARKHSEKSQSHILLNNFLELLTKIPNANFNGKDDYLSEDEIETYETLCEKFEPILNNYLRDLFKAKDSLPEKELPIVHDCIMHYCHQFPILAGKIVNANARLEFPDDWNLIEMFLEHGADLDAREPRSLHTLDKAILSKEPVRNLRKIIEYLSIYPSESINISMLFNKVKYSTLVIAGIYSDISIVNHLVRKFPDKVGVALKSLNDLVDSHSSYRKIETIDDRSFAFTQDQVKIAIGKIALNLTKEHALLIDENCKKFGLEYLRHIVKEVEGLEECIEVYEIYITRPLMNQPDYSFLDSVNPFRFFSPNNLYPMVKIQFIELMQEKIYTIVKSNDYTTQFYNSISDYQKSCLEIFDGAVFSETHYKHGVDNKYKKLLEERINQSPGTFISKS